MRLQKVDYIILLIACFLIAIYFYQKQDKVFIPTTPHTPVIMPNNPVLEKTIFFDEYDNAKKISKQYNKKLILIFGADWCPYCKDLKKDIGKIKDIKEYIVCFINIDNSRELVEEYKIKGLPTSIILSNDKEEARKSGYKYNDYCKWLQDSNHGEKTWSDLPF